MSADFPSAVALPFQPAKLCAGWKSKSQQVGNLRYSLFHLVPDELYTPFLHRQQMLLPLA